jgi:hypothetical protein
MRSSRYFQERKRSNFRKPLSFVEQTVFCPEFGVPVPVTAGGFSWRVQGHRQDRVKLKIRDKSVIHLKVWSGSSPGSWLFVEYRGHIDLPVPIFYWVRVIGDVRRSRAIVNGTPETRSMKQRERARFEITRHPAPSLEISRSGYFERNSGVLNV